MSNSFYKENKNTYEQLKLFITDAVQQAEEVDSLSESRSWQEQLEQLEDWMLNPQGVDPIPDQSWALAGLTRPGLNADLPLDEPATGGDGSQPADDLVPARDFQEEDAFTPVLNESRRTSDPIDTLIEELNAALEQPDPDDSLISNFDSLKAFWNTLSEEQKAGYTEVFSGINERVIQKREEYTSRLLVIIDNTENLDEKNRLIQQANQWNPSSDPELSNRIDELNSQFGRSASKESIRGHLIFLATSFESDMEQFTSSLKYLQQMRHTHPELFTQENITAIEQAERDRNAKLVAGGKLTSMMATGNLLDAYVALLEIQRSNNRILLLDAVYMSREEAEERARKNYTGVSARYLQDFIQKVRAYTSPRIAIEQINERLNARIDITINGIKETIDGEPFTEEDKKQLIELRNQIKRDDLPREIEGEQFISEAKDAESIYLRITKLIKSYKSFPQRTVSTEITDLFQEASNEKLFSIEQAYKHLINLISRVQEYSLDDAKRQLEEIKNKLVAFDMQLAEDWFGIPGYDDVINKEPLVRLQLPPRPDKLKQYTLRDGGELHTKLNNDLDALDRAITRMSRLDREIRELLENPTTENQRKAKEKFDGANDDHDLHSMRSYKELEELVLRHVGIAEKLGQLKTLSKLNKYDELLDYYDRNVTNADNIDEKTALEIQEIVKQAEIRQHENNLDRFYENRNYSAAMDEVRWLQDRDATNGKARQKAIIDALEVVVAESKEIRSFYNKSYQALNIKDDEPLLTIFSMQESWVRKLRKKDLPHSSTIFIQSLLDETGKFFDEKKIAEEYAKLFAGRDFEFLRTFTERMSYLSGQFLGTEPNWPQIPTNCTVRYDAERVATICRDLFKASIQTSLESKEMDKDSVLAMIKAYRKLNYGSDKGYDDILHKHALISARNVDSSLVRDIKPTEMRYELWKAFAELFPRSEVIEEEFYKVREQVYRENLERFILMKEWDRAAKEIEKNSLDMRPSVDLLRLEYSFYINYTNTKYFSPKNAELVLNKIEKCCSPLTKELPTLKAKLTLAKVMDRTDRDMLRAIEILGGVEYQGDDLILAEREEIVKILNNQIYDSVIEKQNANNIGAMIDDIVKLYNLMDITKKDVPDGTLRIMSSADFKRELFNFLQALNFDVDQLINPKVCLLDKHIVAVEEKIPLMKGALKVLKLVYKPANDNVRLADLLGIQGNDALTLSTLENALRELEFNKGRDLEIQKLFSELRNFEIWSTFVEDVFAGRNEAENNIQTKVEECPDIVNPHMFTDAYQVYASINDWIEQTKGMYQSYHGLRNCDETEYEHSSRYLMTLRDVLTNQLPILFDPEFTDQMKAKLDARMKLNREGMIEIYVGLDNMKIFLDKRNEQINSLAEKERDILNIQTNFNALQTDLANKHQQWQDLLTDAEMARFKEYSDAFAAAITNEGNDPGPGFHFDLFPSKPEDEMDGTKREAKPGRGLIDVIQGWIRPVQERQMSPREKLLRRQFANLTIEDQLVLLERALSILRSLRHEEITENLLSETAEATELRISNTIASLQNKIHAIEKTQNIAKNKIDETPLRDIKEIETWFKQGHYAKVLDDYIKVSPVRNLIARENVRQNILNRIAEQ